MHTRNSVDRLYWKRADGGRGFQIVEEDVESELSFLGYITLTKVKGIC